MLYSLKQCLNNKYFATWWHVAIIIKRTVAYLPTDSLKLTVVFVPPFSRQISHLCSHYLSNYGSPSLLHNQQSATSVNREVEKSSTWIKHEHALGSSPFLFQTSAKWQTGVVWGCVCGWGNSGLVVEAPQLTSWDKLGYKTLLLNLPVTLPLPQGSEMTASSPV